MLIVSANMGQGHNATGRALEDAIRQRWPDATVRWVNALERLGPGFEGLFQRIYVANVESVPWLYEFFYAAIWRIPWFAAASRWFTAAWCGRRLAKPIAEFAPDLVLSTYPMGTAGLAWLRRKGKLRAPIGAWVSDFAPHPFWVYGAADLTMVMHDVAVAPALRSSPSAHVGVSAPPVRAVFRPGDQTAARHELGLPPDAFVPLVSCGSLGFGEIETTVRELLAADPSVAPIAICGRNDAAAARLRALGEPRLHVVGWTDQPERYTLAADVVVTNAGGATSLEALACGRPVLMHRPIAAHGKANARLMAAAGLALVSTKDGELAETVRGLLAEPERLKEMAEAVARHCETATPLVEALESLVSAPLNPPTQRLRPEDALFVHVATPEVPQQVGAVLLFDPKADGTPVTHADAEHLLAATPGLRTRLLPGSRLWRARWQEDPGRTSADVLTSVRMGPEAPLDEALTREMDAFFSEPVSPEHPVRARLVTGIEGEQGALLIALHHAASDGIAVISALVGQARGKEPLTPVAVPRRRGWWRRPNVALGASDAPNATLGASHAPNATLGASGVPDAALGASHASNAALGASGAADAALGASHASNATLGASGAPNATLGASHAPNAALGASHAPNATLGRNGSHPERSAPRVALASLAAPVRAALARVASPVWHRLERPSGPSSRSGTAEPARAKPSQRNQAAELARGVWTLARAGAAPRVGWDKRIDSPRRHFARAHLSAPEVRKAARRAGVPTTNLVLALVAEALHRELGGTAPERLRVLIPMSVRDTGTFRQLGNHTGAASVDLPTGAMSLSERVRATDRMLSDQVGHGAPRAGNAVVRVLGILPPALHRRAAKLVYRGTWFSVIASVLPGARSPVVLNGALVRTVYPVLSLAPGVPVAVGIMTWADRFTVCITVPAGQEARGDRLAAAVVEAFGRV
ncbi:WS/DGAT domain-containing protein [Amycolatopsis sp. La24]|uniref:MGDG synthase family glycosyltransferase n=1 Tax=Amycolatopsis sp. La24 TaxID=3028304 RepID=UPI0023AFDCC6|nr:WS/DGAT domain-containing protein [Amycolatopsis sp. La24]